MENKWISVEKALPLPLASELYWYDFPRSYPVLLTDGKHTYLGRSRICLDREFHEFGECPEWVQAGPDGYLVQNITHWMPLPELPE